MWTPPIPDGPLHPEDAVVALIVGLAVATVARFTVVGPFLVVGAAAATFEWRHGGVLTAGIVDRPAPLWALLGVVTATAAVAWLATPRRSGSARAVVVVTVVPVALVWGLVADTEAAVIGGMVLVGGVVVGARRPSGIMALTAVIAPVAALVGSSGRPSQLLLALVAVTAGAAVTRLGMEAVRLARRRLAQRAGTPMTVASGATSSTTTAPAATTAP